MNLLSRLRVPALVLALLGLAVLTRGRPVVLVALSALFLLLVHPPRWAHALRLWGGPDGPAAPSLLASVLLFAQGALFLWITVEAEPPMPLDPWFVLEAALGASLFLAAQRTGTWPRRALAASLLGCAVGAAAHVHTFASITPGDPLPFPVGLAGFLGATAVSLVTVAALTTRSSPGILWAGTALLLAEFWCVEDYTFVDLGGYGYQLESRSDTLYWDVSLDPARDLVAYPDEVIALLPLEPGVAVADIGSAAGYFTFPLARAVGPDGDVFAADINMKEGLLALMRPRMDDLELNPHDNITLMRNKPWSLGLPEASIDLAFMNQVGLLLSPEATAGSDPLHSPTDELAMVQSVHEALVPGGWLVVIDLIEDPLRPFPRYTSLFAYAEDPEHVRANYEQVGFRFVRAHDLYLDEDHHRAQRALEANPGFERLDSYLIGRDKIFFLFRKEPPGSPPLDCDPVGP